MWSAQLIPIILRKFLNIPYLSAFVSPSASISFVEMYKMTISFRSTFSRVQCQRTSISFVFGRNSGFSVSAIALLLHAYNLTGWPGRRNARQAKNWAAYNASFLASVVAIYSTSVDDKATVLRSFDWCDRSPPDKHKKFNRLQIFDRL